MNANQLHGTFRNLAGQVQETAGRLLGSNRQQLKGLQLQVLGRAQKKLGDFQMDGRAAIGRIRSVRP